jgi:carboxymethylenebutenolidase
VSLPITESRPVAPGGTPALMCRPDGPGPFPCFILLHERYGLVPHTEDLARKLSGDGFVVCAPDLFYTHPDQQALHDGTVGVKPSDGEVLALLEDAHELFRAEPSADLGRLGMMGVCQTGRYPFVWAKHHPLQACITLYGAAQKRDWEINERQPWGMGGLIDAIDTSVLGIFGEKDHIISFDDVIRLRAALEHGNLSYQLTIYADAPHGWLNDTMPGRYRPEIAKQTWSEVVAFLKRTLSGAPPPDTIDWSFTARKHLDYDFTKNVRLE